METTTELYLTGDTGMVMPLMKAVSEEKSPGNSTDYADFEQRIVIDRNKTMASRAKPILDSGSVFMAVGALHLPGNEGVIELLRKDGFTITAIVWELTAPRSRRPRMRFAGVGANCLAANPPGGVSATAICREDRVPKAAVYCRLPSPLRSAAVKSFITRFMNSLWPTTPSRLASLRENCWVVKTLAHFRGLQAAILAFVQVVKAVVMKA